MSAVRPCCHAGAAGVVAEIRGAAGGVVCAQPDKTLIATSALKMALFFIMENSPFIDLLPCKFAC